MDATVLAGILDPLRAKHPDHLDIFGQDDTSEEDVDRRGPARICPPSCDVDASQACEVALDNLESFRCGYSMDMAHFLGALSTTAHWIDTNLQSM